jgi:glycosyltransferase involved in cell wall biosynthesis
VSSLKVISIITVTYNCEETIEKTILSIVNQDYNNKELIIIDGSSTDKTLSIINKYIHKVKLFVEKDSGIYDAMNKGISKANGDWVIFMNSGDNFFSNFTLSQIAKCFFTDKFVIAGSSLYKYPSKYQIHEPIRFRNGVMPASHQSIFIKKDIIKKYLFNINYKVAADYDQLFRIYLKYPNCFLYINDIISIVDGIGFSTINNDLHLIEYRLILSNYSNKLFGSFWFYKKICIKYFKKLVKL